MDWIATGSKLDLQIPAWTWTGLNRDGARIGLDWTGSRLAWTWTGLDLDWIEIGLTNTGVDLDWT